MSSYAAPPNGYDFGGSAQAGAPLNAPAFAPQLPPVVAPAPAPTPAPVTTHVPISALQPVATPIVMIGERIDTFALSIGSRITVSTLMLACVLVICVGASSMLGSLRKMDSDVKVMNGQLATTYKIGHELNTTLAPLPPTSAHLKIIVGTIDKTGAQMVVSGKAVHALAGSTAGINKNLGAISANTGRMRGSLESVDKKATALGTSVDTINMKIAPLAAVQHQTAVQVARMRGGLAGMNSSLAYVIRTLNYLTLPPTGGGFTVNVDLPKEALPPLPGIKATASPTMVFPRGAWPIYTGP